MDKNQVLNTLRNEVRDVRYRGRLIAHALLASELSRQSFSQCGEDLILRFAFQSLGIFHPSYLDVGAHHPLRLSNSALFYQHGGRGVNVEPNPLLFQSFVRRRRQDVNLNIGVGVSDGHLEFYIMDNPELSTFSRAVAEDYQSRQGIGLRSVISVPVRSINEVLECYGPPKGFDLLSLDVEGWDEDILSVIDFARFAPLAFCVETIDFATGEKCVSKVEEILLCHDYFIYADTYINTIFFHKSRFRQLRERMSQPSGA